MKIPPEIHHHRLHRYSWTGYLFGGALLLVGLIDLLVLEEAIYSPLAAYIPIVPGIALLLRSHRPPIGISRGIGLIAGGIIAGGLPLLMTSINDSRILWAGLIAGLLGAIMLGYGFSPKPEKEYHYQY